MTGSISDKLIQPNELIKYLCISKPTLYRLVSERKIPYCKVGGSLRFRKADIDNYLEKSLVEPFKG